MSNLNEFVENSIGGFGVISDPFCLPETFEISASGSAFELFDTTKEFQITGRIFEVQFSGFSNILHRLQAGSDISRGSLSIDAVIPSVRISGQYKLAVAIGLDASWTATGSWIIAGKHLSSAHLKINHWQFKKRGQDEAISFDSANIPYQFHLFGILNKDGILGSRKYVVEDLVAGFKDLFECPGAQKHDITENMKAAIYRALSKEIHAQIEPLLGARLMEELRQHLQADINEIGFFEIMSGCVTPPPTGRRPKTAKNTCQAPSEWMSSSRTVVPASSDQQKECITPSEPDISEVVLSTNTTYTENEMIVKIVIQKTIIFKHK